MQMSFSELEYAAKKKQTRRDLFLAQIEAVTPWTSLTQVIGPHYPSSGGRHRKTRYKGLAKNTAQLFSLFGFANLMLARRWLLSADSQVAS